MVAPAKTPAPVTNALIEAFSSALKAPEVQAKLAPLQLYPVNMCGADFAAFLKKEDAVTGAIVRETGMKAE
jgi:tripartite-type tricarboxylate transporter receptor subunit TctC